MWDPGAKRVEGFSGSEWRGDRADGPSLAGKCMKAQLPCLLLSSQQIITPYWSSSMYTSHDCFRSHVSSPAAFTPLVPRAVPVPSLPPELLSEIITLATASPDADRLTPDWSNKSAIDTLLSLCLTSHAFNLLASTFLYSRLSLPTAQEASALVRTLDSARWTTGPCAGKAKVWVKDMTLGQHAGIYEEQDGGFVAEVLARVAGGRVERVALVGLQLLGPKVFQQMAGALPDLYSSYNSGSWTDKLRVRCRGAPP